MKALMMLLLCSGLLLASGCKKDDPSSPGTGTVCGTDDFTFPASATKFSVTLYSECQSVSVGTEFFVKLVLYNVSQAFGAAFELTLPSDKVDLVSAASGSAFGPAADVIALGGPIQGTNNYAYGVTYKAGTNGSLTGSGVLVKLRFRAKAAGAASFTIIPGTLEIKKSDGTPIANFGTITLENVAVTVQ